MRRGKLTVPRSPLAAPRCRLGTYERAASTPRLATGSPHVGPSPWDRPATSGGDLSAPSPHHRGMCVGCRRTDVVLGLIGDVLPRRGRRFPPDDWGTTSVIWRTSKFRAPNAVPDPVRRPHSATVKADQDQHSPMKPGGRRRRRPRASSTGAIGHVPAGYSTSLGRYWPGVVRTARTPAPRGVHPALPQQLPLLVHCVRVRPGPQW